MSDLDQATRLAAQLFTSTTAFILTDAQEIVACSGPLPGDTALSLCAQAMLGRDVVVVPAASQPQGVHAADPGEAHRRVSAAAPLLDPAGRSLGALCLADCPADSDRDGLHTDLLRQLAQLAAAQIRRRNDEAEAVAGAERAARAADMRLRSAIELLPEGLAIFDAEDRLVLWNSRFEEQDVESASLLRIGARFEDLLRASVAQHRVPSAIGREEAWIAERQARHAEPGSPHEDRLASGRWIRARERRTPDGGSIWMRVDITDQKEREEPFRLLFAANPVPMYLYDINSLEYLAVNDAALALYGYEREAFCSLTLLDTRPERDRDALRRSIARSGGNYVPDRIWTHVCADGREVQVKVYGKAMDYEGREASLVAVVDVTEQQKAEDELRRTRAFLDGVVDGIPAAVFVKDMRDDGRYVLFNQFGQNLVGRSRDQLVGRTDEDIYGADIAERLRAEDQAALVAGGLQVIEEQPAYRADGEIRYIRTKKLPVADADDGAVRFVLGVCEDITERRAIEMRIAHMAHHDALTDLPNRVLFRERLEAATLRACRHGERLAVLWIDLDQFKSVNDALGHPTGDALLQAVAGRLRLCLRNTDTAARFGGDEFAILQAPIEKPQDAGRLASRLLEALSAPYDIDGQQLVIGASIGISLAPRDGADADALLRTADIALYHAKSDGRGVYRFFEAGMNADVQARRALDMDLRRALAQGEFEVWYQPVVDLTTNRISGCEALLRWRHPERGLVSPSTFVPVAEEIGLIVPLGEWALRQACADAAAWPPHLRVAVNLSPVQFRRRTLATTVALALAASGLAPHRLELEITESVLLVDNEVNLTTLHQLHALGARISLDDFGTGYSSLSYLRSFPFDKIKIDRSFVADLEQSSDCLAIVRAVTSLGTNLGMTTVAEGVETPLQLDRLRAEGCREAQGYLFSRPLPAHEIAPLLLGRPLAILAA